MEVFTVEVTSKLIIKLVTELLAKLKTQVKIRQLEEPYGHLVQ